MRFFSISNTSSKLFHLKGVITLYIVFKMLTSLIRMNIECAEAFLVKCNICPKACFVTVNDHSF